MINVLSLFDGMSCGQIALERANISVANYYASEIDKHAIAITQHYYPNTIQLGDITQIDSTKLPKIDLMIGGSPCQGFSFSGKRLNFDDPRSKLFFEYVRLLKEVKPTYWLLENVVMKKEFSNTITEILGIAPVEINSSLVSAQNRKRLYWANFKITQPIDKGIKLCDILETTPNWKRASILGRRINERGVRDDYNKNVPITQCLEVREIVTNKSNCLTTVDKDNILTPMPIGRHKDAFKNKLQFRYLTLKECCRLQTVPDNYFDNLISDTYAKQLLGNGWTIDVIVHILKGLNL